MPIADFPVGLTNLLNTGWVKSYPALDIDLGGGDFLHLSTIPITFDGTTYDDHLARVNSVKESLSRAVDRCDLTIDNSDLVIGDQLLGETADEVLDNSLATLHWIYVNMDDPTEMYRVTRLSGVIQTFTEDDTSELNVTLISDAFAGGGVAPFDVRPTCVWQYKDGINCTYSGANPTCDFTLDGANGCIVHFGREMALATYGGGAVDIPTAVADRFGGITEPTGGYTRDPECFLAGTPVYSDYSLAERPIESFKRGDNLLSFNRDNLEPTAGTAQNSTLVGFAREWYECVFSDGSIIRATGRHPFFPEAGKMVRVEDFKIGMRFRRLAVGRGWRTVKLIRRTRQIAPDGVPVYNVPESSNHEYFANGFPVGNRKADPYDPLFY